MVSTAAVLLALMCTGVATAAAEARSRFSSSRRRPSQTIQFGYDDFERSNRMDGIPIFLAESLNKVKTLAELEKLVDQPSRMRFDVQSVARNADSDVLGNRFGRTSLTASGNRNGEMAEAAVCKPELRTVPVKENKEANVIYWPSCTRVERCGGCCSHELLSCQPTANKTIHVQVIRAQYEGGSSRGVRYTGTEMVPLVIHTACECGCKVTPDDCNGFQEYVKSECRCKCVNKEDYQKCSQNSLKMWEPSTCRCKCRQERECSTGHYFDLNTCACKRLPSREDRPFDPVLGNRFFSSFQNFYSSDNKPVNDVQQARNADRAGARTSRPVRVRGPQRSGRWDYRARRTQG